MTRWKPSLKKDSCTRELVRAHPSGRTKEVEASLTFLCTFNFRKISVASKR